VANGVRRSVAAGVLGAMCVLAPAVLASPGAVGGCTCCCPHQSTTTHASLLCRRTRPHRAGTRRDSFRS
jgi:hypothetical protein